MSDITIFKLEDLGMDVFDSHTIKVKSKKNDTASSFSNELSYPGIPHYDVTVFNNARTSLGANYSAGLYDGGDSSGISRGSVVVGDTKTVPITQGQIYTSSSEVTFSNPTTGETGNPFTISSDIKLNLIKKGS